MPIEGVTDKKGAYPRLGVLRKGSPKKKVYSKKYKREVEVVGDDLDHFRFVTDNPEAMARFREVYGDEPRTINVFLPFATVEENLDAWMREFGAGSIKVKCSRPKNRENGVVLWQDDQGMFHTEPKVCQWPNCKCEPSGILTVIIPELVEVAGIGAVWVLTTSWNDCDELSANLAAAESTARSLGRDLRGIPFVLYRRLDDVSCPPREGSDGKRVRDKKWLLHIEPHASWVAEQMQASRRLASPLSTPLLNAGPDEFDTLLAEDYEEVEEQETVDAEVITPAPEKQPAPADLPKKAPDLLRYVNQHVDVPFDNITAMRRELHEAGLEGKNWPDYDKDPGWWEAALQLTLDIARAKVKAEQPELM